VSPKRQPTTQPAKGCRPWLTTSPDGIWTLPESSSLVMSGRKGIYGVPVRHLGNIYDSGGHSR
jgi:hypothetical protein